MKICSFFILVFWSSAVFAQNDISHDLQNQFDQYQSQAPQEKLFVHTDKSFYVAGDILWFKVYDVDASTHQPTELSKVSYVEVMDKENKAILQAKISLQNGAGNGSFLLPFSIASGNYVLRAYTNWMKNFDDGFFYEKRITIVNTLKNGGESDSNKAVYRIQFFPEGGNLVNGIESTVGFKAVNQNGQSISFSGFLINKKSDTILRFQPLKFGMGRFAFTPNSNEIYKAVIKVNNQVVSQALPQIYNQGYVMKRLPSADQNIHISVTTNSHPAEPLVYLLVHSGKKTETIQMKVLNEGKAEFVVDEAALSEGISAFTLFNNAKQPLCERMFCKAPRHELEIGITPDATLYNTRKKIQLQIDTKDAQLPVNANLSLSVYRLDSLQNIATDNIFNYLWLTSEVKGTIESPDYYLNNSSAEADEALDNLMLTQGWRRFQWNEVEKSNKPSFRFLPEYEGEIIEAKITDERSGLPLQNQVTYLSIPGEKFAFSTASSDDSGNIRWTVDHYNGAGELIMQTGDSNARFRIALQDPFSGTPYHTALLPFHLSEKWKNALLDNSLTAQTQNAYLSDERQHFTITETDTTAFYGKPDKRYRLDDYTRFPAMEEVMREYVTEVRVSKGGEKYHYTVDNLPYRVFFKDEPLVLMDGVPVWDINKIIAFDPLLVKQLDVVTHKYYLGNQAYSGIVSYSTYKGDMGGIELNPNAVQVEYEGLQLQREFYVPVYETPQQISSRIPDFRNVLYWQPDVNTDSNGKATVTFYTSDLEGNYAAELQGNTGKGLAGSKVMSFSVKK